MGIKKGQKVWVWQDRCGITETTIKTIGRKYITLEYPYNMKFNIDDLKENNYCGLPAFIILDIEEYKREQHYDSLKIKLRRTNWDKVKQSDLDKIEEIMKECF
ncbi:hypothetical protein [Clostridium beijerinckii]|uniref:beta barrel domain-containing protein n=1 Tax=Clostridium beijerinckii TaxID=1520 RepID=UPI001F1B4836|nr:hypothetical protein [Clostridium beijerinckii]